MNAPQTGLTTRQEFGVMSTTHGGTESAATAVAAQSKAMVEARYVMALQRPRDWDQVRQNLLKECRRPSFAHNKSAFYVKPIGQGVEGLGIRFVEVALRCMTNVLVETTMIFEDADKEIHRVSVTDLESNLTYPMDVRVSKSVERSKPMDDGNYISVRTNSYGKKVYTVPGTDDDLLNKRAALISKAVRTLGLRIIPGDLQDEGEEIIKAIRLDDAASDPGSARKKIVDAFDSIGVKASDLTGYLGHSLDACSPSELVKLRGIYGAIKDGEATWKEVTDNPQEEEKAKAGPTPYPDDKFATELPKWRKLIADGKKTPDEIIATAATKHTLSDAQRDAIRAPETGAPAVTFESVRNAIKAAQTVDALDEAAALITATGAGNVQQKELSSLYNERREALGE